MLHIHPATSDHVSAIARIMRQVWPDTRADSARIAAAMQEPNHAAFVALMNGEVVGFADGFLTLSSTGIRRWELDLLAVQPSAQNRGIAHQLLLVSADAGRDLGASVARAFVKVDNLPSERAFIHAGYLSDPTTCELYVSSAPASVQPDSAPGLHLFPVATFNYTGLWLEGELTLQGFLLAQAVRARYGWDVAGAVIPLANETAIRHARAATYTPAGRYRWWHLNLT